MPPWSDGIDRSAQYRGTDLQRAIAKYFGDRMDEERLALLWENEAMRHDEEVMEEIKALAAGA